MAPWVAYSGMVDLRPDANGDRIGVVRDGQVAYLPAKRVNIGSGAVGGGSCRYIKRSKNGDLYVTGPGLGLFCSKDGGNTWTDSPLNIPGLGFMGAFTILRNDDFLVAHSGGTEVQIARSSDQGRTWTVGKMVGTISPYKFIHMDNAELLELADGTILMTCNLRHADGAQYGQTLPEQRGAFVYVFHSADGGRTWPQKSMVTMYGAETHLLQLPSGKVLAAIRKQRWHRNPGDPASVLQLKQRHGYTVGVGGGFIEDAEQANRIKNMFVSESFDGGYTWVNERQVSDFMQCSGDMTVLSDRTLVLQYLHRYDDRMAKEGMRARVSHDQGKTWEPQEYVIGEGGNYPGGIDMPDGSMITMCPNGGQIQAVHWRPVAKDQPALTFRAGPARAIQPAGAEGAEAASAPISVIRGGQTTELPAQRVNMLPVPAPGSGSRHASIRYGQHGITIQRSSKGALLCMGNVLGPALLRSNDEGRTWTNSKFDIEGWGSLIALTVLHDDTLLIAFEPVGGSHRTMWLGRSKDDGRTWSIEQAKLDLHPFSHFSQDSGTMLELADGSLILGLQLWKEGETPEGSGEDGAAGPHAYVVRSVDGGTTWSKEGRISQSAEQARLIQVAPNKLRACFYKQSQRSMFLAESSDVGKSWTNERKVPGIPDDVGPGGLTLLADGRLVLQFLHRYDTQGNYRLGSNPFLTISSEGVRAMVSPDGGETWSDEVYVVGKWGSEGYGSYIPSGMSAAEGKMVTVCVNEVSRGLRLQSVVWQP